MCFCILYIINYGPYWHLQCSTNWHTLWPFMCCSSWTFISIHVVQMILALSSWTYGTIQIYVVFNVVISSQNVIKEHEMLSESICEKKTRGWIVHEDPYLDKIIRFLNKFDGFNANDYFTLNKPLLIGMFANFVTYFIILVQFSYIWTLHVKN